MSGIKRHLASLFALLLLVACAKQPYRAGESDAHKEYERRDFEEALKSLEKQQFRKADRLLYLLDKGMILHALGRYDESNQVFEEAYHFAEFTESRTTPQELAASLGNENFLPYNGEKYERLLIQTFQMLNFAALGQWSEALVEVRQYHNNAQRFFGAPTPKAYQDSFSLELASILWGIKGYKDDARIDSERAQKANPKAEDLSQGNVIVIAEVGLAPILIGEKTWVADILIELPRLQERETRTTTVKITEEKNGLDEKTIPLDNISNMASANLEHKLEIAKTHKFVKTAVKQWAEMNAYFRLKHQDANTPEWVQLTQALFATAAISATFNLLEAADLRSWSTLPNQFQMTRLNLSEGPHTLKIQKLDETGTPFGKPIEKKITVKNNQPVFVPVRLF